MSSTTTQSGGSVVISSKALWSAVIATLVVLFVAWLIQIGGHARAAIEQQYKADMAAESLALCTKWGTPAGSPRHAECIADIEAVRAHHWERIMQDIAY